MTRHTLASLRARHAEFERRLVLAALERAGWSLSGAGAELGVPHSTVATLIDRHGLGELYAEHARPRGRPAKGA